MVFVVKPFCQDVKRHPLPFALQVLEGLPPEVQLALGLISFVSSTLPLLPREHSAELVQVARPLGSCLGPVPPSGPDVVPLPHLLPKSPSPTDNNDASRRPEGPKKFPRIGRRSRASQERRGGGGRRRQKVGRLGVSGGGVEVRSHGDGVRVGRGAATVEAAEGYVGRAPPAR